MTPTVLEGNIFTSSAQTMVNTVNCEGVMGAGLALECRLRYPAMFERYQQLCAEGLLTPGKLWLFKGHDRWILNFPTKLSWKQPSRWEYLTQGLENLAASFQQRGITSLALPLLGADKGGLDGSKVEALMQAALEPVAAQIPVCIYRYQPHASDDLFVQFSRQLQQCSLTELSQQSGVTESRLKTLQQAVTSGDFAQINQLAKVPGIGLKTLERIYHSCQQAAHPVMGQLFD